MREGIASFFLGNNVRFALAYFPESPATLAVGQLQVRNIAQFNNVRDARVAEKPPTTDLAALSHPIVHPAIIAGANQRFNWPDAIPPLNRPMQLLRLPLAPNPTVAPQIMRLNVQRVHRIFGTRDCNS